MSRIASRQTPLSPRAVRGAAGMALALGIAGLAAPAFADCSAGPMSVSAGGQNYTCTRNCTATSGGRARLIRTVVFSGHGATASQCMAECSRTLGCTAVSYHVSTEMRDGIPFTTVNCVLIGGAEPSTADEPSTRPGRYAGVCYRDPPGGLWRDPRIQAGLDTFRQDQFRPGVPGFSTPLPKQP